MTTVLWPGGLGNVNALKVEFSSSMLHRLQASKVFYAIAGGRLLHDPAVSKHAGNRTLAGRMQLGRR
jgi:hypothetical protein